MRLSESEKPPPAQRGGEEKSPPEVDGFLEPAAAPSPDRFELDPSRSYAAGKYVRRIGAG
jgi:hypothetical protein